MLFQSNRKLAISFVSWTFFLLCSLGLFTLGFQEFQKYLAEPEAVDFSSGYQFKFDLPVFTFCPLGYGLEPSNLNLTNIAKCNLTYEDIVTHGKSSGTGGPECENPEKFWEFIHLTLNDFGIKAIHLVYTDKTIHSIKVDEIDPIWRRRLIADYGTEDELKTCYSLTLPKMQKSIMKMVLRIEQNYALGVFTHSFGLLDNIYPTTSKDFGSTALFAIGSSLDIKYVQNVILKDNNGKLCLPDEFYSLSDHYLTQTEQVKNFFSIASL